MSQESIHYCVLDRAGGPIEWREPPACGAPTLGDDVHLWRIELAVAGDVEEMARTLSDDERARAGRFHFEVHRRRYVVGRATLRAILAGYLQCSPQAVVLIYERWGKPRLAGSSGSSGLEFNVSHSEDLGLVAVRNGGPVGIDVERVDRSVDHLAVAAEHFSPREADAVADASPAARAETFLRIWTRREAVLKTTGVGLAGDVFRLAELARRCAVREFSPAPGFIAALSFAVQAPPPQH